MRRSARLRSVMLRMTKIVPWNCASSAASGAPESETGMVWPLRVAMTDSRVSRPVASRENDSRSP
jgi:hypothetical protein